MTKWVMHSTEPGSQPVSPMSTPESVGQLLAARHARARLFARLCALFTAGSVAVVVVLLASVAFDGIPWLDVQFLASFPSRFPAEAGIKSALYGTCWLIVGTAVISIPLGVGAAIYLEEYARPTWINRMIELNIANLAGVPSIIYGMLGLAIFVRGLAFERSVLAGALTLSLLILPMIIMTAREAIRAVPRSIRLAAFALGATPWQTIRDHVLPEALPGIMTGVILALSRAIGETAPLIMIGALTYVAFVPEGPMDAFTALPIQIFNWISRPQPDFHALAAAAIVVLLAVLFALNAVAVAIRMIWSRR